MSSITVLGAGAFGTALAVALAGAGSPVRLVARDEAQAEKLRRSGENAQRLAGVRFPDALEVSHDIPGSSDIYLAAIPTQALAGYLKNNASRLDSRTIVACNKGIDLTTGLGPTGIISSVLKTARAAVLSGPGFAIDIASGLPTALTLASRDEALARELQLALSTPSLRLYRTDDVAGVEIGGALKNVIAIACGLTIGAGLGESARAALLTRGYAELTRFAAHRGARADTLAGLSGLGDLVLTCTSAKSRNFSHGISVATGDVPNGTKTVEGVATAEIVSDLAKKADLDVPITDMVNAVLTGRINMEMARDLILSRPLRKE